MALIRGTLKKAMKTLVFGASGFVGFYLKNYFKAIGTSSSDKEGYRKVNFLNKNEISHIIESEKPELIINSAGLTNVDECERNPELAFKLNGETVSAIIDGAKKVNAKLIQISTDYVFDGKTGNYKEKDKTNPINIYGKSKLAGEESTLSYENSIILRIEMPYGINLAKNKTVFFESMINNLREGKEVNAAVDQIISPTYVGDIGKAIDILIKNNERGIFHLASREHLSRYEFVEKIAEIFGFNKSLIRKTSLDDFKFAAQRPKNTFLNIEKISNLIKINALEENLNEIKSRL